MNKTVQKQAGVARWRAHEQKDDGKESRQSGQADIH